MQAPGAMRPPLGVHFDAPFGDNLDDLLALSLLYSLDNRNECRVIGLSTSKDCLTSAGLYEVYQKLYGSRPTAIGMAGGKGRTEAGPLLKVASEGQAITVKSVLDTAEPHGLIRNLLTAQHDGNAVIIATGPTDNLRDLLRLETARPVVAAKVRTLYLVGAEAKPVVDWPSPVVVVEAPVGLSYRPKAADFAWNEKHPAAQVDHSKKCTIYLDRGTPAGATHARLEECPGIDNRGPGLDGY
jgi:hypothetical protein